MRIGNCRTTCTASNGSFLHCSDNFIYTIHIYKSVVMRSHSQSANPRYFSPLGVFSPSRRCSDSPIHISSIPTFGRHRTTSYLGVKLSGSWVGRHGLRQRTSQVGSTDEGLSSFDVWGDDEGIVEHMLSSSEDEENEGEVTGPVTDVDLPTTRELTTGDSFAVTAHRFAMLRRGRRRSRIKYGVINNIGLLTFLTALLLFVDWCAWRIVRLPLESFYLMRPFCISAAAVSCVGYVCVPLLRGFKILAIIRKEGPSRHFSKRRTPTMGGLFLVPIGIIVAEVLVGFSSTEVSAAAAATLAFSAIGLLDDILSNIKNHNNGLSAKMRMLLELAVGSLFSFWLDATKISSPYSMYTILKMLVPLPAPLGLICLGKFYLFLTSFCFVSMANGVDLTDGLDGLAGGTAALAFVGMSIAVLPICSDLAVFGASMAGACIGFLSHNRYKASVFMGDTGSLALGGALAAMASCTGMFLPLFISSGIFVLEAASVMMQVSFFRATKHLRGAGRRLFRMAPFHHHLELSGVEEPIIVAGAYVVSCVLTLFAGYVGLVSA